MQMEVLRCGIKNACLRLMFACSPVLEMSSPLGISVPYFKGQFYLQASLEAGYVQGA